MLGVVGHANRIGVLLVLGLLDAKMQRHPVGVAAVPFVYQGVDFLQGSALVDEVGNLAVAVPVVPLFPPLFDSFVKGRIPSFDFEGSGDYVAPLGDVPPPLAHAVIVWG